MIYLGVLALITIGSSYNPVVFGSDTSAGAFKEAAVPDACDDARDRIELLRREIADLRDEIRSLQEDVLAGKNVEWSLEQIERLRDEIRDIQNLIGTIQRFINQNC